MTDISMWDEQTEQIAAAHVASTQALAIAAVEPLWPYLSQAATRSEFDDRLALAGDNLTRMLTQTGLSATAATGAAESLCERFEAHLATRTHAEAQQAHSDRVAASLRAVAVKVPGYCTQCRKIKQVNVTFPVSNNPTGVCDDCKKKQEKKSSLRTAGWGMVRPDHGDAPLWGAIYATQEEAQAHLDKVKGRTDDLVPSDISKYEVQQVEGEPNKTAKHTEGGFRDHLPEVLQPFPKGTFWPLVAEQPDYGLFGPKGDFTFAPGDRVLVHSTGGTWGDEPCPGTVVAVNGDQAVVTTDYSGMAQYAAPVDHLTPLREPAQVAASLDDINAPYPKGVCGASFEETHAPRYEGEKTRCHRCGAQVAIKSLSGRDGQIPGHYTDGRPWDGTSAVHALLQAEGYFSTRDAVDSMEGRKPRYQQGTETTTTPQRTPGKANPSIEKWRKHQETHPNEWADSMEETRNRMRIDDNHADAASVFAASLHSASDAEWAEAEGLLAQGGFFLHQQNQADPHATVLEGYRNQSEEAVDEPPRTRPTEPVQPKQADAYDQQRAKERADEASMNRAKDEYYARHPHERRYDTISGSEFAEHPHRRSPINVSTIVGSQHQAVNENAYGADRYLRTPTPPTPDWITDEWEDGKATQEELDQGRAAHQPENPFADTLTTIRQVASRHLAAGPPIFDCDAYRAGHPARTVTPCGFTTNDPVEWTRHLEKNHRQYLPSRKDNRPTPIPRKDSSRHLAGEPSSREGLECRFCHKPVRHLYGQVVDEQNHSECPENPAPFPKNNHSVYIESLDGGRKQSARRTAVEQPAGEVSSQTAGENLRGDVPSSDFDTPPAQPRTTRPRVMPGGDQAASQPNLVTVDTQVLPGPQMDPMGDQMGGGGFDMGYADAMSPSPDQLVAARIARIASRVLLDNPTLGAEQARALAAQTVATYPEMVSLSR